MELVKRSCWNPYFVSTSDREYEVGTISVFDENGVICKQNQGWWGYNNSIGTVEIPVGVVRKNKVDFSCKSAFIVKGATTYGDVKYDLYIPNSVMNVQEPTYEKYADMIKVETTCGFDDRMVFEKYIPNNGKLQKIKDELRSMEDCAKYYLYSTDTAIENVEKFLKTLKKKKKEEERLANMTAKEIYDEIMSSK